MTFVGGSVYEGGNRRLGPPILNFVYPVEVHLPSKGSGLYANRISEAFRISVVHKNRRFYGQQQNRQLLAFGGDLTKNRVFCFMGGVIVPPSKLIVTNNCPPPRFLFLLGGVNYEGGRSNQKSSFMRGVIVPPSKLIVTNMFFVPHVYFCFLLGGVYY